MAAFKPGDVVQLKSGGPKMTCSYVEPEGTGSVLCQWFEGCMLLKSYFPPEVLELVKEVEFEQEETT